MAGGVSIDYLVGICRREPREGVGNYWVIYTWFLAGNYLTKLTANPTQFTTIKISKFSLCGNSKYAQKDFFMNFYVVWLCERYLGSWNLHENPRWKIPLSITKIKRNEKLKIPIVEKLIKIMQNWFHVSNIIKPKVTEKVERKLVPIACKFPRQFPSSTYQHFPATENFFDS